jgi:hypothetical protein
MLILLSILAAYVVVAALIGTFVLVLFFKDILRDHRSAQRFQRHLTIHRSGGKLY